MAELFSGIGGFTARLNRNIFRVRFALDMDAIANSVYKNFNPFTKVITEDIQNVGNFKSLGKSPDIVLAGPPCQGFSLVGMKTKKELSSMKNYNSNSDPRNFLPLEAVRVSEQLRPKILIIENVPAMNTQIVSYRGQDIPLVHILRNMLGEAGYSVTEPFLLEASKLGIPQRRKRSFVIASLFAKIKPSEIISAQDRIFQVSGIKDVDHAIRDIEAIPMMSKRSNEVPVFPDHIGRVPNQDDIRIIQNLRPGENYNTLLKRKPEVILDRKHKVYSTSSFADKFYRLRWDKPSRAIVAHLQKDGNSFIHPSLNRPISVREAARIQSFPDSFYFGIAMSPAYRLIGNAVPPLMGQFIVETVSRIVGLSNEKQAVESSFASLIN